MKIFRLPAMNDQVAALARVLPGVMQHMMEMTAKEDVPPESVTDLTRARAVLGDLLSQAHQHQRELRALPPLPKHERST